MPIYQRSQTGVGTTNPILLDTFQGAGGVAIQCVVTGTVTFSVEHSNDYSRNADGVRAAPVTWFTDANISAKTANIESNMVVPVQWIRLNVTAGSGTVAMNVVQAGPGR